MISEPWRRVAPIPIPTQPTITDALDHLSDDELAALVHANLLPRDPAQRRTWGELWAVIAGDQDLTDTITTALEGWLTIAENAQDTTTDPKTAKRIAKFIDTAEDALDRLDQPLAWAGPVARAYNRPARRTLDTLVGAITTHRGATSTPTPADRTLWSVLADCDLDPATPTAPSSTASQVTVDDHALDWAGPVAVKYTQPGRTAVQHFVTAIDQHRHATQDPSPADARLWDELAGLGLDPRQARPNGDATPPA